MSANTVRKVGRFQEYRMGGAGRSHAGAPPAPGSSWVAEVVEGGAEAVLVGHPHLRTILAAIRTYCELGSFELSVKSVHKRKLRITSRQN